MKTPEQMAEEFSNFFTGERRKTMAKKSWWTGYKAAQQWISVKERLPEEGQEILWYHALGGEYCVGQLTDATTPPFFTHWMPLPEAPKEEK